MCGIVGMFRPAGVDTRGLGAMTNALAHRGPDQAWTAGVLPFDPSQGNAPIAGLGVRRLAIVDVAGGTQPALDASGRWWVCLNGQIYNHNRIRQELHAQGVPFREHGDAEVVAQLVANVGVESALGQLVGQFALAIVDSHERRLWLVRDRMGQKPLYWTLLSNGSLLWASELRAIRNHPDVRLVENQTALQAALLWEFVPSPWTPFQGIHKLTPGGRLFFDGAAPSVDRWYVPPVPKTGRDGNFARWARSVRGSLDVAVMQRLQADVPVGALLSGGVDSTAVAALAQSHLRSPLATFAVSIQAPGFDEGPTARAAAATLGSYHRQFPMTVDDLDELAMDVLQHMDEPLADSSLLPTWLLMRAVRAEGIKCVLSGDGADELFCGYPTTLAHRLAPLATPMASTLRRVLSRIPPNSEGISTEFMAKRFVEGLSLPFPWRHSTWMGAWLPSEVQANPVIDQFLADIAAPSDGADPVCRALHMDQRLYLGDGVLTKVDRASMAHGVEVRSPFLDHRLVELAADIGIGHKLGMPRRSGLFRGKKVLKAAVADLLPASTLRQPKHGFGSPIGPWLRRAEGPVLDNLPSQLEDLIPPDKMRQAIDEHKRGTVDHRRRIWSAIVVAQWRNGPWGPQR